MLKLLWFGKFEFFSCILSKPNVTFRGTKLDNTLQGRWREAPISDHFDHFPHEYIGVFFVFFSQKKWEKTIFCSKKGVQKGVQSRWIPIRKSQFVKVFFSEPWFDFWKIVEADMTQGVSRSPFTPSTPLKIPLAETKSFGNIYP